ncbi:DUF4919 domain-containing protein [Taibaiella koreensis]|uniref:DUF4919 domain-containing protein n=1 Tax=Taibaiella koreensis TaxID=1268548 RepID=UPI000E5A0015|nr:DUF4919 domain-containing protein [Taibaiella koreensis]
MKKILVLFLLLSWACLAQGQKILTVDFDEVKKETSDPSSPFFYDTLVNNFLKGDTLSVQELRYLYYGAALQPNGSLRNLSDIGGRHTDFDGYFEKQQFREALSPGLAVLREDPVNIRMSYNMLVCYHELGIRDSAQLFARRYYGLLKAIQSSGDGTTVPTAFVVTRIPDEYDVVREAGFASAGQTLLTPETGHTDKIHLDTAAQEQEPKIPALYFNIEISFITMRQLLEGKIPPPPEKPRSKK